MPTDIKTTRNHSWNVAFQQQVGDNMAFSATYLGNHMVNMWGVVDGNPGADSGWRLADRPVHAQAADGRDADVCELLDGAARSPPRVEPGESGCRSVLRLPRLDHRRRLAELPRAAALGAAPFGGRDHDQRQLHHLDVRRADQSGPGAAQRRDRIHEARLADQPAIGRRARRDLRGRQGAMQHVAQAHFQPQRERRDAAVQQRDGAHAGIRLAACQGSTARTRALR